MIGVLLSGPIEKNQDLITKYMIESVCSCFDRDNIIVLTTLKNKLHNLINGDLCNIVNLPRLNDDWDVFLKECDEFISKYDLETLVIVKQQMAYGFRKDEQGKLKKAVGNMCKKINGEFDIIVSPLTYASVNNILNKSIFVEFAQIKGLKIIHYCLDPHELQYTNEVRLGSLSDNLMDYVPCYEYLLIKDSFIFEPIFDFTFYCSAVNDDRKWIADKKAGLENDNNFVCKTNIKILTRESKKNEEVSQGGLL